jgi:hypothetical protein
VKKQKLKSTRKPELTDVPEFLSNVTHFVTGSVRFGVQTSDSDIDICIPITEKVGVADSQPSEYNNGIKFLSDGIVVNVIHLHPLDYVAWHRAAKMAESCGIFKGLSKDLRYPLHEMLVAVAKASLHGRVVMGLNFKEYLF